MDLIVWFGEQGNGEDSPPIAFQLCYDKALAEKALNWDPQRGFSHMLVDDGEGLPGKFKATPLLVPDGACDRSAIAGRFAEAAADLPPTIRAFVTTKLSPAADASLNMAFDAAPSNRDPDPC